MTSVEFDEQFPRCREWLRQEIHKYRDAVSVYRCINERTKDHLAELNLAPGFFRTTESALFTLIALKGSGLYLRP
jgi:hypothetical protein